MTSRDFCFWLQGFLELDQLSNGPDEMNGEQIESIRNHLALVFKHEIDPSMGNETKQTALNQIHHSGQSNTVMRC